MLLYFYALPSPTLYRLTTKGLTLLTKLSLLDRLISKKILILGREFYSVIQKSFPPLSERDLKKAILAEGQDLFPFKDPDFVYLVFKKESSLEVAFYGWEKSLTQEIRKVFPMTHVIPEEMLYLPKELIVVLHKREPHYLLFATKPGSPPQSLITRGTPSPQDLTIFFHSLADYIPKGIPLFAFGVDQSELSSLMPKELLARSTFSASPLRLWESTIEAINLKPFKIKTYQLPRVNPEVILLHASRLILLFVLALQLQQLFSIYEYHRAIERVKKAISALQTKAPTIKATNNTQSFEEAQAKRSLVAEFRIIEQSSTFHPLVFLNELSKVLPDGARVTALNYRNQKVELFLESKDFFETLIPLRKSPLFKDLKIPNPPYFDPHQKRYRFKLEGSLP